MMTDRLILGCALGVIALLLAVIWEGLGLLLDIADYLEGQQ